MASNSDMVPELVTVGGSNPAAARRIRRLAAEGRLRRLMIPTVYREDYLLPLKALSHHREAQPRVASMSRVQRWSAAFDYSKTRSAEGWCFRRARVETIEEPTDVIPEASPVNEANSN